MGRKWQKLIAVEVMVQRNRGAGNTRSQQQSDATDRYGPIFLFMTWLLMKPCCYRELQEWVVHQSPQCANKSARFGNGSCVCEQVFERSVGSF